MERYGISGPQDAFNGQSDGLSHAYVCFVGTLQTGLWDQGVFPHFCDTRESPLMGG